MILPSLLALLKLLDNSRLVANDQKRFTTPSQALRDGASHLVIGRPITKADNPKEAATKILAEIQGV